MSTSAELDGKRYNLTAYLSYDVTDAPVRDVPYTRTGARYQPKKVNIHFSASSECDTSSLDLHVYDVSIWGLKLKKDGTVGNADCNEKLYSYEKDWPEWVTELVKHAEGDL